MLLIFFGFLVSAPEVLGQRQVHNYTWDTLKIFSPGYVCNYEAYYVSYPQFVIYTCVHESKCHRGSMRVKREPELKFDNCPYIFHPPSEGGTYTCCHPQENEDTKNNPNATLAPLITRYMPGFRSAFKCNDYSKLICLDDQYCPTTFNRRQYLDEKGGKETKIGKYPHLALIGYYNPETHAQNWFCLGTIVTEWFILSAATCKEDNDTNLASVVRVGVDDLCKLGTQFCEESKLSQRIIIDKHIPHPANLLGYYYHDIMLFKLKEGIKLSRLARPACLYAEMNTMEADGMFAMYEAKKSDRNELPVKITPHELEIEVFDTESCSRWYRWDLRMADQPAEIDPELMFCAGHERNTNPCKYDFGGPLQIMDYTPYCMWQVFGVMAWSNKFFCKGALPPIFTRVTHYLDWIEEIIWYDFNILIEHDTCSGICTKPLVNSAGVIEGRCKA